MSQVGAHSERHADGAALTRRLVELCDQTLAELVAGPGRSMVQQVRDKLQTPLTVTVAGGVSSGKSTLVNALLGQRIAAVDAGECTRVVSEFRFGVHERAEVVGVDGSVSAISLDRGRMPEHLGRPVEEIERVVVHLSNALLQQLAVVDTPGLNTVTDSNETTSTRFLGIAGRAGEQTATAVGRADALVFLLPVLRQADAEVLRGFATLLGGSSLSASSSVAVLSKADRLDRSGDPLATARPIARRMATELRGLVSDVIPVVGLLAETARAAVFTEADARAVLSVAAVTDAFDRDDMFLSPEDFLRTALLDLDVGIRRRLLGLLDLFGLQVAVAAADGGARTAAPMLRVFEQRSGFEALRSAVIARFGGQADVFKAASALSDLRRAAHLRVDAGNARALDRLRTPLERIELDGSMHRLHVLQVASAVAAGEVELPPMLLDDVLRFSGDATTELTSTAVAAGASRWAVWGNDPRRNPIEVRHARAMKGAFELRWRGGGS